MAGTGLGREQQHRRGDRRSGCPGRAGQRHERDAGTYSRSRSQTANLASGEHGTFRNARPDQHEARPGNIKPLEGDGDAAASSKQTRTAPVDSMVPTEPCS